MKRLALVRACAVVGLTASGARAASDDIFLGTANGALFARDGNTLAGYASDSFGTAPISGLRVLSNNDIALTQASINPTVIRVRRINGSTTDGIATDTFGGPAFSALAVQSNDRLVTHQYDGTTSPSTTLRLRTITPPDTTGSFNPGYDQGNFGNTTTGALQVMHNDNVVFGTDAGQLWIRSAANLSGVAFDSFGGGAIKALGVQSDDDIVFAQYDGTTTTLRIRRLNGSTTDGIAVDQGAFGNITGLGILSNDNVVIGNDQGQIWVRSGLDLSGIASDSFGGGEITALAVQNDDDIFLSQYDGTTTTLRLRRINGNTTDGIAADTGLFGRVTAAAVKPAPLIPPEWNVNASGDWHDPANWLSGIPNATGAVANFKSVITAPRTVVADSDVRVGTLRFQNANSYVIAGLGTLTLQTNTGSALIEVLSGSHTINLETSLASNTTADVAFGAALTLGDPLSIASGKTLTKTGSGTLSIVSTVTGAGPVTFAVQGGTANVALDAGSEVTVNASGGTTNFQHTQHLAALSITNGATTVLASSGDKSISTPTVAVTGTGKLDLKNNKLITATAIGTWNGTGYTGLTGSVAAGRNGGAWNGAGITTSEAAATAGTDYTGIGIATGTQVTGVGSSATALWGGQIVFGSDTLIMYTYGGDANLSGAIDGDDFLQIDAGFLAQSTGYANGDFNYSGNIDADDYFIIDRNYSRQGAPFETALPVDFDASTVAAVPEPHSLLSITLLAGAVSTRRRRPQGSDNASR
jgi:hypothetical protein